MYAYYKHNDKAKCFACFYVFNLFVFKLKNSVRDAHERVNEKKKKSGVGNRENHLTVTHHFVFKPSLRLCA